MKASRKKKKKIDNAPEIEKSPVESALTDKEQRFLMEYSKGLSLGAAYKKIVPSVKNKNVARNGGHRMMVRIKKNYPGKCFWTSGALGSSASAGSLTVTLETKTPW